MNKRERECVEKSEDLFAELQAMVLIIEIGANFPLRIYTLY